MKNRTLEIIVGFCCIGVVLIFLAYMFLSLYTKNNSQYYIHASFNNIGGLTSGSAVSMRGVKIGKITNIRLSKTYEVLLDIEINYNIPIPTDSVLAIESSGMFSSPMLTITPGSASSSLKNNDKVINTKDWVSLEDKIGSIFLNGKQ